MATTKRPATLILLLLGAPTIPVLAYVLSSYWFSKADSPKRDLARKAPAVEAATPEVAFRSKARPRPRPAFASPEPEGSAIASEAAASDSKPSPFSVEARRERARRAEANTKRLLEDVYAETTDASWAAETEAAIMDVMRQKVMTDAKDVQIENATCRSKRCAIEARMTSMQSVEATVRELAMVRGLGKAIYRRTDLDEGFTLRAVMARPGYDVEGNVAEAAKVQSKQSVR